MVYYRKVVFNTGWVTILVYKSVPMWRLSAVTSMSEPWRFFLITGMFGSIPTAQFSVKLRAASPRMRVDWITLREVLVC